jgi:hypothetical protein
MLTTEFLRLREGVALLQLSSLTRPIVKDRGRGAAKRDAAARPWRSRDASPTC